MSPEYEYQCEHGHRAAIWQHMGDMEEEIPCPTCGKPAQRVMSFTQRPIVKGGTPNHHGQRGVS